MQRDAFVQALQQQCHHLRCGPCQLRL